MKQKLKRTIARYLLNYRGWKTDRKIVVIESDDWGALRMPSKSVYENLLSIGIPLNKSAYNKKDTLESRTDLIHLFNLLLKFKDVNGNHPIITFNTVMGNPDFEKISETNFDEYRFEHFFESYKKYHQDDLSSVWFQAMDDGLIRPQFHAREHLNVNLWMNALREGYEETLIAFCHKFYGLKTKTPSNYQSNYLAAYWAESKEDYEDKVKILKDGLAIFKETFGFTSKSFVACNFIYPSELEKVLCELGVTFIQSQRGHLSPSIDGKDMGTRRQYTGKLSRYNQCYMVRNCYFEPALNEKKDWVNSCLKEIRSSFFWGKPAIISSHRINYVSGVYSGNGDQGLTKLRQLLNNIMNEWPDVEFMTSDKLGTLICKDL